MTWAQQADISVFLSEYILIRFAETLLFGKVKVTVKGLPTKPLIKKQFYNVITTVIGKNP